MIANRKNIRSSNNAKSLWKRKQRKNESGDLLPRLFAYLIHPFSMHKGAQEKKRRERQYDDSFCFFLALSVVAY